MLCSLLPVGVPCMYPPSSRMSVVLIFVLVLLGCAYSQNASDKQLIDTACDFNSSGLAVQEEFYQEVRAKHGVGVNDSYDQRNALGPLYGVKNVRCYGACPGSVNFTWCVNIFGSGEVCIDPTGTNPTPIAELSAIENRFFLPSDCGRSREGCLGVTDIPFYFHRSYFTCTSQSDSCYHKTFIKFKVLVDRFAFEPPEIQSFPSVDLLTLGETSILECEAVLRGRTPSLGWTHNGTSFRNIAEDPFCTEDGCKIDSHPESLELKTKRVRSYNYWRRRTICPFAEWIFYAILWIDNTTESDAGTYTCTAKVILSSPLEEDYVLNKTLNATTVLPAVPLDIVEVPPSSYSDSSGVKFTWNCTVKAGVGVTISWIFEGSPVPSNGSHNCSSPDQICNDDVFTTFSELYLGDYTYQYQTTLHFLDAQGDDSGEYLCRATTQNGTNIEIGLVQLDIEPDTQPDGNDDVKIVVPVISAVLLVAAVALVFILLFACRMRNQRHAKPGLSIIYTEEPCLLTLDCKKKGIMADDPMEFPRSRLQVFSNRVLGEGTFGKVLQAKAEGIVESTPERNIVAVKTVKDDATSIESEDLWDELELMKSMKPHENILNLLGHCTLGGGPLYLIVEYAKYGSLRDFLKQCEEAVLSLNHMPIVTRGRRKSSSSSVSSTYPLLVDKTPLSAQNSVFSSSTPIDSNSFVFPGSHHRLRTQDSGFFGDSVITENFESACAQGMLVPYAHTVAPLTHDYINTKGLVYMEDVQNFALQLACGLQHLENMQIVHCDLAARNILIAEGFVLKISDFGMARDVGEKAYYRKSHKGKLPVKWTAPESLEHFLFTYKSDIWSFGVVLWEIFSYGRTPYPDMKIRGSWETFISSLKNGKRLSQPDGCPDSFYDIMLQCWELDPQQRPTASDLITTLTPDSNTCSSEGSPLPDISSTDSKETDV